MKLLLLRACWQHRVMGASADLVLPAGLTCFVSCSWGEGGGARGLRESALAKAGTDAVKGRGNMNQKPGGKTGDVAQGRERRSL